MSDVKLVRLGRSVGGGVLSHHAPLFGRRPDVVNLEDHLDELAGEEDLRLLAVEALDHVLLLHIEVPGAHAVDAEGGVLLRHLNKIQLVFDNLPSFALYILIGIGWLFRSLICIITSTSGD